MMTTLFQDAKKPFRVEASGIKEHSPKVVLKIGRTDCFAEVSIHLNTAEDLIALGVQITNLGRGLRATPFVPENRTEVEIPQPFDGILEP